MEGLQNIQRIMASLREKPPAKLAGAPVVETRDYLQREIVHLPAGTTAPITLPVSDVLYYAAEDGSWVCVRPSGTEPKIKIYFGVYLPPAASIQIAETRLAKVVDDIKEIVDNALA